MKEKPFLSTTLCKVDRALTLGQPPCIKVCCFPSLFGQNTLGSLGILKLIVYNKC